MHVPGVFGRLAGAGGGAGTVAGAELSVDHRKTWRQAMELVWAWGLGHTENTLAGQVFWILLLPMQSRWRRNAANGTLWCP